MSVDIKQALFEFLTDDASLSDAGRDAARDDIRNLLGSNIYFEDRRPHGAEPMSLTMSRIAGQRLTKVSGSANFAIPIISFSIWSSDATNTSGQPEKLYVAISKLLHGYRGALNDDVTAKAIHIEGEPFDRSYPPPDGTDNWLHQKTFSFSFGYEV